MKALSTPAVKKLPVHVQGYRIRLCYSRGYSSDDSGVLASHAERHCKTRFLPIIKRRHHKKDLLRRSAAFEHRSDAACLLHTGDWGNFYGCDQRVLDAGGSRGQRKFADVAAE
jgi:hypothetical protein